MAPPRSLAPVALSSLWLPSGRAVGLLANQSFSTGAACHSAAALDDSLWLFQLAARARRAGAAAPA
eukprot:CAMPEP_0179031964 /NCGR_PEP_ID=MMETSP0796-20121207/11339_1 /TAXON_ID=73915 /ORGANISM="Pyrodinium bahamense, Strain pbaha01" /LENGTH=65 /DNA_ID=CAMNT_0020728167 /DNA_START=71 /DNA_END=265 /DNA_ORIENTATION=-